MSDSLHFDIPLQPRVRPVLRPRVAGRTLNDAELPAAEPINIFHWAAVALVTAVMCAVLAYAAGTPALSRAASVTSGVFGAIGGGLVIGALLGAARTRWLRRGTSRDGAVR